MRRMRLEDRLDRLAMRLALEPMAGVGLQPHRLALEVDVGSGRRDVRPLPHRLEVADRKGVGFVGRWQG